MNVLELDLNIVSGFIDGMKVALGVLRKRT